MFTNDDSQRVLYHFKAPTDKFYVERITPYLYSGAQANLDCGQISYEPIEIEKSKNLVKWKTEQINSLDLTKDLEFSIYTEQESDLYNEFSFTIKIKATETPT